MKITEEWLKNEISLTEDNLEFLKSLADRESDLSDLKSYQEGRISAFQHVLMRKKTSNRTCKIFPLNVPQWKRNIIRFLTHICDWLEGVEDKNLFKRDMLEIRSDNARKRSKNTEELNEI